MKNINCDTICDVTQEPHKLQRFIGKSAVTKYHQLLTKDISMKGNVCFDQFTTASLSKCCACLFDAKTLAMNKSCILGASHFLRFII